MNKRNTMNHLTVGQRAPLSNLAIDDTAPITNSADGK